MDKDDEAKRSSSDRDEPLREGEVLGLGERRPEGSLGSGHRVRRGVDRAPSRPFNRRRRRNHRDEPPTQLWCDGIDMGAGGSGTVSISAPERRMRTVLAAILLSAVPFQERFASRR